MYGPIESNRENPIDTHRCVATSKAPRSRSAKMAASTSRKATYSAEEAWTLLYDEAFIRTLDTCTCITQSDIKVDIYDSDVSLNYFLP